MTFFPTGGNVLAPMGYATGLYIERLPLDRPVSEHDVVSCLRRAGVAKTDVAVRHLVMSGQLVRLEDGSFQRHKVAQPKEAAATSRDDNPEFAAFRAGVLKIIDERLSELGLIA
jgi:hypothetical protein